MKSLVSGCFLCIYSASVKFKFFWFIGIPPFLSVSLFDRILFYQGKKFLQSLFRYKPTLILVSAHRFLSLYLKFGFISKSLKAVFAGCKELIKFNGIFI